MDIGTMCCLFVFERCCCRTLTCCQCRRTSHRSPPDYGKPISELRSDLLDSIVPLETRVPAVHTLVSLEDLEARAMSIGCLPRPRRSPRRRWGFDAGGAAASGSPAPGAAPDGAGLRRLRSRLPRPRRRPRWGFDACAAASPAPGVAPGGAGASTPAKDTAPVQSDDEDGAELISPERGDSDQASSP
jgi:hypothetical protein